MRYVRLFLLVLSVSLSAQGCRTAAPFDEDEIAENRIQLMVKNESINEMNIYTVTGGVSTRVGSVSGLSTKVFSLDQSMFRASDTRIIGTPIGGDGRASTGPLNVARGQTIDFTIRTTLRSSTVSIH